MKYTNSKFKLVLAASTLAAFGGSCGQSPEQENVAPTAQPAPVVSTPQPEALLQNSCTSSGGVIIQSGTQKLCKTTRTVTRNNALQFVKNNFPALTESSPQNPTSINTGAQVKAGDKLSYAGIGGFGEMSVNKGSILGGIIQYVFVEKECTLATLTGWRPDKEYTMINGNMPAGLMASDGTEVFLLGESINNRTINNTGTLRIGFNTPDGYNCGQLLIYHLTITHCEDANGTTHSCE